MAKDINLTSQEWCDIVFEKRNKEYGAYKIRRTTSKRHTTALIAILLIAIFIAVLPTLIKKVVEATRSFSGGLTEQTVLTELNEMKDEVEENIAQKQEAPPPPPLKSTIKFTAPVITSSDEITEDDAMKSQDELNETKVQISTATIQGTDEQNGMDIQDLDNNRKITQEVKEDEVYRVVEQMPEYPGGMEKLHAYISSHIQYPQQAKENFIQGTTVIQFVVAKDGSVDKVTVYASSHPFLDQEAIRVVKSLPKWIPGKINGKSVACYYIIPISFKLQ